MPKSVKIELWFESVEEMIDVMDNSTLANRRAQPVRYGDRPAIDPNEPASDLDENMSNLAGMTSVEDDEDDEPPKPQAKAGVNSAPPILRPRKRRAYLKHNDGRVIETLDQDVVDQWLGEGAKTITRKEFDQEMAKMPAEPSGLSPGEVIDMPSRNVKWDDVRDMVRRVNAECSLTRLKELLAQFGCSRVGELPEEQYAPFVQAAAKEIEAVQRGQSHG